MYTQHHTKKFKILLYYKYIAIDNPVEIQTWQKSLCQDLRLKGRIIISTEGLNGTIAGSPKDIDSYINQTSSHQLFNDIEWKVSWSDNEVFPKLKVVVRDEIVTLGVKKNGTDVSLQNTASYIEPEELLKLYESNEDFVILDARNAYEAGIGKFKGALIPPIDNFREFPQFAQSLENYKDKEVVTYCTGGVRCEKASAYLREQGFKKVRQLHGGIHEYGEKAGGKYFEGELFVFDNRLHVSINQVNPTIISQCVYCNQKVARYVDCAEHSCDELFICCESCEEKHQGACSPDCQRKLSS